MNVRKNLLRVFNRSVMYLIIDQKGKNRIRSDRTILLFADIKLIQRILSSNHQINYMIKKKKSKKKENVDNKSGGTQVLRHPKTL